MTNYSMLLAAQQQLHDYTVRLRFATSAFSDPRSFYAVLPRLGSEPKPSHSYIGLIAMAILSSPQQQLVLSDIYQWILDRYPYFRARSSGWRNSIRHNLSLNDCFVKAGRAANGKGHYWSIHPANLADFLSGDFRRRRAQRRVRKSMGLPIPDDEDEEDDDDDEQHFEPSLTQFSTKKLRSDVNNLPVPSSLDSGNISNNFPSGYLSDRQSVVIARAPLLSTPSQQDPCKTASDRKRCFDVDSLLAPDRPRPIKRPRCHLDRTKNVHSPFSKSDGSTDTETST